MKRFWFWLLAAVTAGLVVFLLSRRAPEPTPAPAVLETTLPPARPTERAAVPVRVEPVSEPVAARPDALALEEMRGLVNQNRISDARNRATRFFRDYPDSPYGERVERLTGVHPRRR